MVSTLFAEINWNDLSSIFQSFIIDNLLISFNKVYLKDQFFNNIRERFTKKDCIINLYYEESILKGICVSWYCDKYLYLDKFFILFDKKGLGVGSAMLNEFIKKYGNGNGNERDNKLLWRTDSLTSKFYLKHSDVIKHFELNHHNDKNKDTILDRKVYLGVGKINWEYEDLYELNIRSCFERIIF